MQANSQWLIWKGQVLLSLNWLRAFFDGSAGAPLRRDVFLVDRLFEGRFAVAMDASPWGIGGVLLDSGRPVGAFSDSVSSEDVRRLEISVGDHRAQAVLEGLAILVALRVFAR